MQHTYSLGANLLPGDQTHTRTLDQAFPYGEVTKIDTL